MLVFATALVVVFVLATAAFNAAVALTISPVDEELLCMDGGTGDEPLPLFRMAEWTGADSAVVVPVELTCAEELSVPLGPADVTVVDAVIVDDPEVLVALFCKAGGFTLVAVDVPCATRGAADDVEVTRPKIAG